MSKKRQESAQALIDLEKIGVDLVPRGTPLHIADNEKPKEELPEIKSLGLVKVKLKYALVRITTQGKKVINIDYGEALAFPFAMDELKMAIMEDYYDARRGN